MVTAVSRPKTLIAYYSRSGTTRGVAQALAARLGHADLEPIDSLLPRAGYVGYAQSALESLAWLTPAIGAAQHDPRDYDLVVVGTPIWFWSLASPVRTWLVQQREALARARLAFFCTMGGSGASFAFERMAALAGHEPVATLALTDEQVQHGAARAIADFAHELQPAAAPRRRTRARRRKS